MSLSKFQELVMNREAWRAASQWSHKELDMTEWLNWTEHVYTYRIFFHLENIKIIGIEFLEFQMVENMVSKCTLLFFSENNYVLYYLLA